MPLLPFKALIRLLLVFQRAVAAVLPVGDAATMTVSVGGAAFIPDGTSSAVVCGLSPEQSRQPAQGVDGESYAYCDRNNYIQQEILIGGHFVHGRSKVVCPFVPENVANPIDGPGHRVARLIFVNV